MQLSRITAAVLVASLLNIFASGDGSRLCAQQQTGSVTSNTGMLQSSIVPSSPVPQQIQQFPGRSSASTMLPGPDESDCTCANGFPSEAVVPSPRSAPTPQPTKPKLNGRAKLAQVLGIWSYPIQNHPKPINPEEMRLPIGNQITIDWGFCGGGEERWPTLFYEVHDFPFRDPWNNWFWTVQRQMSSHQSELRGYDGTGAVHIVVRPNGAITDMAPYNGPERAHKDVEATPRTMQALAVIVRRVGYLPPFPINSKVRCLHLIVSGSSNFSPSAMRILRTMPVWPGGEIPSYAPSR